MSQEPQLLEKFEIKKEIQEMVELSGNRIAGSSEKTIYLYDLNKKTLIGELLEHTENITTLFALKDGRLVSAGDDNKVIIWDTKACKAEKVINFDVPNRFKMIQSSDDTLVMINNGIHCCNLKTYQVDEMSQMDVNVIIQLADSQVATGSSDGTVTIWSAAMKNPKELVKQSKEIESLIQLKNGNLVTVINSGSVSILNISTGDYIQQYDRIDGTTGIFEITGDRLVGYGSEKPLMVSTFSDQFSEKGEPVSIALMLGIINGKLVALKGGKTCRGTIGVWDLSTFKNLISEASETKYELSNGLLLKNGLLATIKEEDASISLWKL